MGVLGAYRSEAEGVGGRVRDILGSLMHSSWTDSAPLPRLGAHFQRAPPTDSGRTDLSFPSAHGMTVSPVRLA